MPTFVAHRLPLTRLLIMSSLARRVSEFLLAAAWFAALPAAAQQAKEYIAPTDATIVTSSQEGYGSTPSTVIYVSNNSTVAVRIFSFALRQCENVRQQCAPTRVDIRVAPGKREILTHIQPRNAEAGYRYLVTLGYQPDTLATQVRALLRPSTAGSNALSVTPAGVAVTPAAIAPTSAIPNPVPAESYGPDFEFWTDSAVAAVGPRIASLRVVPDSLVLRLGQMFVIGQVKIFAVDAGGAVLGRVRSLRVGVVPGVVTVHADSVVAVRRGRTDINFELKPPSPALSKPLRIIVVSDANN